MMVLHIDCNSFYASCEVSLRPELKGRPVVVANYNEAGGGIILALTKEAKALGLKRGNPVFQVKEVLEQNDVVVFPANLVKYVDISRRIVSVVLELDMVTDFHRYSVDEFFASLPMIENRDDIVDYVSVIKEKIEHGTGIPVSCGIAPTYTLAKVATWYAKHYDGYRGICVLQEQNIKKALQGLPIGDVWGVGWRSAPKMKKMGINTAWDFVQKPKGFVDRVFHLPGVRTWLELQGQAAIDISRSPKQQTIMHSRTFTYMIADKEQLLTCVRDYAVAAARKLRDQKSVCRSVTVFANTNRHRDDLEQYDNSSTVRMTVATADTTAIVKAAEQAFDIFFKPYYQYKRAGVVLGDIVSDDAVEQDMFLSSAETTRKHRRLMRATDDINKRFGMNHIRLASQMLHEEGQREDRNTVTFEPFRNETTEIDDIIEVK